MKKWTRMLGTVIAINLVVIVSVLLLRDWSVETDVKGGPSTVETAESKVPGELHAGVGDEILPGNMGEVGGAETSEPEGTAGSDCQGETEGYAGTVTPGEAGDHTGTEAPGETEDHAGTVAPGETEGYGGTSTPGEAGDHAGAPTPGEAEGQDDALSEAELIDRGKVIYLTFDDGPSRYTAELLDILAKYEVKATFFVTGGNEHYFDLIARQRAEGHTVGIHCFTHDYQKIYASEEAYFTDLQKIDEIIFEQTGEHAQLVRFPGGSSNQVSKFNPGIMTRLTTMVEQKGYRYFDWNVLSGDAEETEDTEEIIQNIISGIQKKDISVVLQHDIYQYSVDAVEAVILWGLENGYTFLPLSMESLKMHHPIAN